MKNRCLCPNNPQYKNYGGRGIDICDAWKDDYVVFRNWAMDNGYRDDLTIDRIDNDGCYKPDNCRWVSYKVQSNNTRHNHQLSYKGETYSIAEWAEIIGLPRSTLSQRITKCKWPIEKALTTPHRHLNKKECVKCF